jgi:hypothetical protein
VGPGSGQVPGADGGTGGVKVQVAVEEMVAGSPGAGERLGVQGRAPGRVDDTEGHGTDAQAHAEQDAVEPPGPLDRFLPERERGLRVAGEEMRAAQGREDGTR